MTAIIPDYINVTKTDFDRKRKSLVQTTAWLAENAPANHQNWKKALEHQLPEAMHLIGLCYNCGICEESNLEKSIQLYQLSAEKELPAPMNKLGKLHLYSEDVEKK
ncbi:SEL1-like repeat protein [Labilibacter marinus]|uniref:sel1 repeat family protein n=1 Tax=Labilibacter marinus TaxID=1477105 RepID=UPI000831D12A|nr:sel1 repeat family protein [Labilibacter marinus]